MDKSGVIASVRNDLLDAIFLTESFRGADELYLDAFFGGETFGISSNLVAQGLSESWEIEDPNALLREIQAHSVGMTPAGNGTGDNNTVEAGETAGDLFSITIL